MRIHGKGERALFSQNWDANTKTILMKYDNLRYRLLPYIYSLAWKVTSEDYTIMRALAFDFRTDAAVNDIPDQYMFGPAFLVNPVTEQMYSLAENNHVEKTRKVYLPKSTTWFDFWTGNKIDGGQTINASAPIETIPLYVKAGSIVPMGPFVQHATEKPADQIELRIYPGADASFKIYEDENDGYNYEKKVYSTIDIKWNDAEHKLTIADRKGKFKGMLTERTFNVVIVTKDHGVGVETSNTFDKVIKYNGKKITTEF
jgi:alpha-D-xyloside xylohydrolase